MLNFNPESGIESLKSNQRAIAAHVDDEHYVRRFTPGMFAVDGTATIGLNAGLRFPVATFPDAAQTRACVSWERPSQWRSGKLALEFWYTCNAGSTNAFNVTLIVDATRYGEVLPGTDLLISTADYAGPAVANTVIRPPIIYTTTSFGSDDELFTVAVRRNGAAGTDTNTGGFELLYLKVRHIPAERESQ